MVQAVRRTFAKQVTSGAAVLALLATLLTVHAGPLDPPAGPVSGTGKTLSEVEPRVAVGAANTPGDADSLYRITQPGSYYLTGNVQGVAGKVGIAIAASGVTLDLNGFALIGPGTGGLGDGIRVTASGLGNIAVVNGSVRGWPQVGVNLGTQSPTNVRVERVSSSANGVHGIFTGTQSVISMCLAQGNQSYGILTGGKSTIADCVASGNGVTGALEGGIGSGSGSTISRCTAADNPGVGIGSNVGSTITGCTSRSNSGAGISCNIGCTIEACTSSNNALDGIVGSSDNVIRGNTCVDNGRSGTGAGIHLLTPGNRIERNHCVTATYGIKVDSGGNTIFSNTCAANGTNWSIVPGNTYGQIVDRTISSSPGVVGNAAASATDTSDALANFSN
jgi:parallel beta-helix repeat protein